MGLGPVWLLLSRVGEEDEGRADRVMQALCKMGEAWIAAGLETAATKGSE